MSEAAPGSGDRFRDLLRRDESQPAAVADSRANSSESASESRSDETAYASYTTRTETPAAARDHQRGESDERPSQSQDERADEVATTASGTEHPTESPVKPASTERAQAEDTASAATNEGTVDEAVEATEKSVQGSHAKQAEKTPGEPSPEAGVAAEKVAAAVEPADVAKPNDSADRPSKAAAADPTGTAGKRTGAKAAPAATEPGRISPAGEAAAKQKANAQSAVDAAHADAPVAADDASKAAEPATPDGAVKSAADPMVAAEGDGEVQVSQMRSTVLGPGTHGEGTTAEAEPTTGTASREKISSPSQAKSGAAGGTARWQAPGAGQGMPATSPATAETGTASTAGSATAAAAPSPITAAPVPTAEASTIAPDAGVSSPGAADASATTEASEVGASNASERQGSAARSPAVRGEPVHAGETLSVADRVRMVQRVTAALETAHARGGELRMRLEPPELGSIRVELSSEGGSISARLEAESSQVQRLLLDSLPQLRERLAEHQIKIEHFQVDVMNQHDRQFAQTRHDQHDQHGGEQRAAPLARHEAGHGEAGEAHREAATLRQQMPWELDRLNVLV